jgi:hypothetical protein
MLRQVIVTFFMLGASPVLGQPRSLLVGNEGTDSPSCGGPNNKCRSISQAIRNSADGDTVFVEAGVYGDLNHNGIIGELGEERGGVLDPNNRSCDCLVLIDKRITVLSERGAAATIIDASTAALAGVRSLSEGAVFGYTGMGFTVLVQKREWPATGIWFHPIGTIAGNRVVGLPYDRDFGPQGNPPSFVQSMGINISAYPGGLVYDNEVSGFFWGIEAGASGIVRNVVTRNHIGVMTANQTYYPDGNPSQSYVADNVIADNEVGISLGLGVGVLAVTGNDLLHNKETGIRFVTEPGTEADNPEVVVQDNNIIDNDWGQPRRGCGLINDSRSLVWAAYNYWGAPGTNNGACNGFGSSTQVDPVRQEPDSRVSN